MSLRMLACCTVILTTVVPAYAQRPVFEAHVGGARSTVPDLPEAVFDPLSAAAFGLTGPDVDLAPNIRRTELGLAVGGGVEMGRLRFEGRYRGVSPTW